MADVTSSSHKPHYHGGTPPVDRAEGCSQRKYAYSDKKAQKHSKGPTSVPSSKYENIQVVHSNNITTIQINRPEKKNALNLKTYQEIHLALEEAGKDDSVLTVITGNGEYFTSGNDRNNAFEKFTGSLEDMIKQSSDIVRKFVCAFIDFPKPLVAMVNGPAIGIGTTILGLCDLVYASEKATFNTPFSKIGLSPEGCSSYIFPRLMGWTKANEVLLFNQTLNAHEACNLGLVTAVFPEHTFQKEVSARLKVYSSYPKDSLILSKQLIRGIDKEKLHEVCQKEFDLLSITSISEDAFNAAQQFLLRKANL
ncbi:enoyl-CoA delta isomerase 2-like [Gastrophryne carolinensis]